MNDYDVLIEEVRASRQQMSAEHAHEVQRYIDYLKSLEQKYSIQVAWFRNQRVLSSHQQEEEVHSAAVQA